MNIDKISNAGKIIQSGRNQPVRGVEQSVSMGTETLSISSEAVKAQEMAAATRQVRATPDVRSERVREVREKLMNGEYDNPGDELLEKIADKIARSLLG